MMNHQKYHKNLAISIVVWTLLFLNGIGTFGLAQNRKTHDVYFEGTDYELHVYKIYGNQSGKTLMLIGGIQGDEPGGFLSADHYADFSLAKGKLIVVPRANFQSIIRQKRQINEDMNRKFADDDKWNYETKIVSILKKLIAESDCLLNLHDGSGFFSEKWESKLRNPNRFGQSIIADCENYQHPQTGEILKLGEIGRTIAKQINIHIDNPKHHFHFNNHQTKRKNSAHKEQRKSATYYALYQCNIPAFGIETSKSLPLEAKIRQHNIAINSFMTLFNIVPEMPGLQLESPQLFYIVVTINASLPIVLQDQATLYLQKNDEIVINHIEANYERGLTADIVGLGSFNDTRKKFKIKTNSKIIVRKDYESCGGIYIVLSEKPSDNKLIVDSDQPPLPSSLLLFQIQVNGKEQITTNNSIVELIRGDSIKIVDIIYGERDSTQFEVNFKGFVSNRGYNTGEDRGALIDTGKDLWKRYSLNKKGDKYKVVVSDKKENEIGELIVKISDPILNYIVYQRDNQEWICAAPGERITMNINQSLKLIDIKTNVLANNQITLFLSYSEKEKIPIDLGQTISPLRQSNPAQSKPEQEVQINIERSSFHLGSIFVKFL